VGNRDHTRGRRARARRRAHHALTPRPQDGTLDVDGTPWQLDECFLASALVSSTSTSPAPRVVLHDGRRYVLRPVEVIAAGKRRRPPPSPPREPTIPFDPTASRHYFDVTF
jgi:hypothetical protein